MMIGVAVQGFPVRKDLQITSKEERYDVMRRSNRPGISDWKDLETFDLRRGDSRKKEDP